MGYKVFFKKTLAIAVIISFVFSSNLFSSDLRLKLDLDRSFAKGTCPGKSSMPFLQGTDSKDLLECKARADGLSNFNANPFASATSLAVQDTVETYEIEIEEKKGGSRIKEIAAFVAVVAIVGYIVIVLMQPEEEEQENTGGNGKPVPFERIPIYSVSF